VVLRPSRLLDPTTQLASLGVALTVLQAAAMASFMVVSGRLMPKHVDGVVQAFWNVLGGALVMVPIAAVTGFVMPSSGRLVAEVLLFALVPTVLANVCFFAAMRRVAPGVVAMIMTLEVALAILWSVLLLDERMSAVKLIGAAVVVVGVLIAQRAARAVGDDPTGEMALGV
jgi:drug/metabolite transporter (DMT)-like permease